MKRQMWDNEDRKRLVDLAQQHTKNKRVQWVAVAEAMGRTANQCKTQYMLRSGVQLEQRNIQWTAQDLKMLYQRVSAYGKRWKFICSEFYKDKCSAEALMHQYTVATQCQQEFRRICTEILEGECHVTEKVVFVFSSCLKLL